jgi:hypothetical protein
MSDQLQACTKNDRCALHIDGCAWLYAKVKVQLCMGPAITTKLYMLFSSKTLYLGYFLLSYSVCCEDLR